MRYCHLLASVFVLVLLGAPTAPALTIVPIAADCDPTRPIEVNTTIDPTMGTGICSSDPTRLDADNVNLGDADGDFYSLGLGGSAMFMVRPGFTGPDGTVLEVTFAGSQQQEATEIFGSITGMTFVSLGVVTNQGNPGSSVRSATIDFTGSYRFIAFHDLSDTFFSNQTPAQMSGDGFDIDSLMLRHIPLPASAMLLLTALGGLGVASRRRRR